MKCPLINKECMGDKCEWFISVDVRNVESQRVEQLKTCVVVQIPSMLIELIRKADGTAKAVESSRNQFIKSSDISHRLLVGIGKMALGRGES